MCIYFVKFGQCKFGTGCSYLHVVTSPDSDIVNTIKVIQEELKFVTNTLKTKELEIKKLIEKVENLEKIIESQEIPTSENEFKCSLCKYSCKSDTVLKRHSSRKNNTETLRKSSAQDSKSKSIQLSPVSDKRVDYKEDNSPTVYKCTICEFSSKSEKVLKDHKNKQHMEEIIREVPFLEASLEMSPVFRKRSEVTSISMSSDFSPSKQFPGSKCPLCEEYFYHEKDFEVHMRDIHKLEEKCSKCSDCVECVLSDFPESAWTLKTFNCCMCDLVFKIWTFSNTMSMKNMSLGTPAIFASSVFLVLSVE